MNYLSRDMSNLLEKNAASKIGIFAMQSEHLQQIMDYYIEDAQNHLKVIEQYLLNLQSTIEDPESVNDLFLAVRCGIIGGTNLLPISSNHINSIHQTGFCLVDCFKVFQREGSLKVDQKLQDLLIQVFYALKALIEQLREPSSLTHENTEKVMFEVKLTRKALMEHLNGLVRGSALSSSASLSRNSNASEIAIVPDASDNIPSLEDLESVIDELSMG